MSGLAGLFERVSRELGRGRRGASLEAQFVAAFGADAEAYLRELEGFVEDAAGRLGLADWPGGRLGSRTAAFGRVGDPECLKALTFELVTGGAGDGELGWLGGPLFRSGRLTAYLRATEEDVGKALAYLRLNIRQELTALRRAADPTGAALFDNLAEAAAAATRDGGLHWDGDGFVLSRGEGPREVEAEATERHIEVLLGSGALEPFAAAVERNERREEGQRNLPLRGAAVIEPFVQHDRGWAESEPARPACEAVDISELANALRPNFPEAEALRERSVAVDEEGVELWGAARPERLAEGPRPLREFFAAWASEVERAPGLSRKRREKLLLILDGLEELQLNTLGEPPDDLRAHLRRSLGLKPQTFSDDWSRLAELAPRKGVC